MFQQDLLQVQAPTIPYQTAARSNNAMTRDYDGYRVSAIGEPDGAGCSRLSQCACDLAVSCRFSKGNFPQSDPDGTLKIGAFRRQRQVKLPQLP